MKNVGNFSKALKWEVEIAVRVTLQLQFTLGAVRDVVSSVLLGMQFRDHTLQFC